MAVAANLLPKSGAMYARRISKPRWMARDVRPHGWAPLTKIMTKINHALLWIEDTPPGHEQNNQTLVEDSSVGAVNIHEAIVELRGPAVLLRVAFQIKLDTLEIDLVDQMEQTDVLLRLVRNLDWSWIFFALPVGVLEAPIDTRTRLQQYWRVVVR